MDTMTFDSGILHYTPSHGLHIITDGDAHFPDRRKAELCETKAELGGGARGQLFGA